MLRNPRRAEKGPAAWFGDSTRELVAAWLVLFVFVAAGLSLLGAHRFGAADCMPMLMMPGAHHHLAAEQEWEDPACHLGSCRHLQSVTESNSESIRAAQTDDDDLVPVYSGSSGIPASPQAQGGGPDERLC